MSNGGAFRASTDTYAKSIGADWHRATGKNAANWARNNMQWLRRQLNAGKEIIDTGEDATRAVRSEASKAEKELIQRRNYTITRP